MFLVCVQMICPDHDKILQKNKNPGLYARVEAKEKANFMTFK